MSPPRRGALALATALFAFSLAAPPTHAADEPQVLRLRAEQLASEDRCEEALEVVRRARAADPADARAAWLEGQCLLRLARYAEAVAPLEDARRQDPALAGATLQLAIARYHLGEFDAAEPLLDEALAQLPQSAEAHLYRGMLLLQRARTREAAAALEHASRLDPRAVDPVASYYAGLAWSAAEERDLSERWLRRTIEEAPGTPWAEQAERVLAGDARRGRPRWWFVATAGAEYDDNVVLRGSGVDLPAEISSSSDWRGVWSVESGVELLSTRNWAGGAVAGYAGTLHDDLRAFDLQYPTLSLWLDRRLDESSFLRLQTEFAYAWVDRNPFLANHAADLEYHRDWGTGGAGRAFLRYARLNYLFSVPDLPLGPGGLDVSRERNRDGNEFVVGYDHALPLGDATLLRGGLRHHRYDARGREYSYEGYEARLGGRRELLLGVVLDVTGSYTYKPYRHASSFPDPGTTQFRSGRRSDDVWRVDVVLERALTDNLTVSTRWSYEDNDSNVPVFDYRRDVVGVYLTAAFGG